MKTDKNKESSKKQKQFSAYAKYSGLAIQMGVTIGGSIYVGYRLDIYFEFSFPIFLLLLMFLSTGGVFYKLYRSIQEENAEE